MNSPLQLKIQDVPAYCRLHYGMTVSRQTVYNWMILGRQNKTLGFQEIRACGHHDIVRVTSPILVDEFLTSVGCQKRLRRVAKARFATVNQKWRHDTLCAWIAEQGGQITPGDLRNKVVAYRPDDLAERALAKLVQLRRGCWNDPARLIFTLYGVTIGCPVVAPGKEKDPSMKFTVSKNVRRQIPSQALPDKAYFTGVLFINNKLMSAEQSNPNLYLRSADRVLNMQTGDFQIIGSTLSIMEYIPVNVTFEVTE